MELQTNNLYGVLQAAVSSANKSLLIISPYIKLNVAEKIIDLVRGKDLDLKLLTLPPGEEYVSGATDLGAIIALRNHGFEIKMLPSLHAKIYLIDDNHLLLGSANFTNKGLGFGEDPNKEILLEKKASKAESDMITSEMWNHEEVRMIDQYTDFEERVRALMAKYETSLKKQLDLIEDDFIKEFGPFTPHEKLLKMLKDNHKIKNYAHIKKGFYKHSFKINNNQNVKVMRSKEGATNQAKGFEVFSYQVTKNTAALYRDRKLKALILILEEPNQFVCLPTTFLLEKVFRKTYAGKYKDFQFKIRRNGSDLLLTIKGNRAVREHNIKQYEGKLTLKILKKKVK